MAERTAPRSEWREGWVLVFASSFGIGLAAFQTYTIGLFIAPLSNAFGWSITQIVLSQTLSALAMALCGPVAGITVDRFGSRPVALTGGVLMCTLFGLLALNGGLLWLFYSLWLGMGIATAFSSPMVWVKAVVDRFERHRGLATSVALCGSAAGSRR